MELDGTRFRTAAKSGLAGCGRRLGRLVEVAEAFRCWSNPPEDRLSWAAAIRRLDGHSRSSRVDHPAPDPLLNCSRCDAEHLRGCRRQGPADHVRVAADSC